MNHHVALATIIFRVFGVSDIAYSVLYWVYGMFINFFESESTFIVTTLWAATFFALGLLLIALSKPLGGLVGRGLDQPMPPPAPPDITV